ncbi:hypothetical protein ASE87_01260 [Frigoribacterium sp. Leaf44]|nr:hypothetical protein ASE87_01260 [Frigoribacterium sp. Leaf44]
MEVSSDEALIVHVSHVSYELLQQLHSFRGVDLPLMVSGHRIQSRTGARSPLEERDALDVLHFEKVVS